MTGGDNEGESTDLAHLPTSANPGGCDIHGEFYMDGMKIPTDPANPCDLCYCIKNNTACVMQECTLKVEGCQPIYADGVCCPVSYICGKISLVHSMPRSITVSPAIKTQRGRFFDSLLYLISTSGVQVWPPVSPPNVSI